MVVPTTSDAKSGSNPTEAAEVSIWSSILQGVSSSKLVHAKSLLILGDPSAGKTTLIRQLQRDHRAVLGLSHATNPNDMDDTPAVTRNELALSYSYADVKDDEGEDTVARLGFYQLAAAHPALMPYALNATNFSDTLAVICLDWQRPWTFVDALEKWIRVLKAAVKQVREEGREPSGWSRGGVVVDEAAERLERFLQEYEEPEKDGEDVKSRVPGAGDVLLPLTEGCLIENLGIPLVVVCCKSDSMTALEKEQDYKDSQFDYIQQALRVVCIKYGAALFYVSTHHPKSYALLRAYVLHRLLGKGSILGEGSTNVASTETGAGGDGVHVPPEDQGAPASPTGAYAPVAAVKSQQTIGGKPLSAYFSYPFRANTLDRDLVAIPSGWDTYNKIKVLRDGFEPSACLDAWDHDLQEADPRYASVHKDENERELGLKREWERRVRDASVALTAQREAGERRRRAEAGQGKDGNGITEAEDEQQFLSRMMELLRKQPTGGAGAVDKIHVMGTSGSASSGTGMMGGYSSGPALVGAFGSRAGLVDLELVEDRARKGTGSNPSSSLLGATDEDLDITAKLAKITAKVSRNTSGSASASAPKTDAAGETSAGVTSSPPNNEVLANFFQSLLTKKPAGTAKVNRKEAAEELDKMRGKPSS